MLIKYSKIANIVEARKIPIKPNPQGLVDTSLYTDEILNKLPLSSLVFEEVIERESFFSYDIKNPEVNLAKNFTNTPKGDEGDIYLRDYSTKHHKFIDGILHEVMGWELTTPFYFPNEYPWEQYAMFLTTQGEWSMYHVWVSIEP